MFGSVLQSIHAFVWLSVRGRKDASVSADRQPLPNVLSPSYAADNENGSMNRMTGN